MNRMEFANEVAKVVNEKLGDEFNVGAIEKNANNGIKQAGISIKKVGSDIGPVIYIDKDYEDYNPIESVADTVIKIYHKYEGNTPKIDVNNFTDWDYVKDRIGVKLLNSKTQAEVFVSAEKFGFSDLILVPYIEIDCSDDNRLTAKFTKELLGNFEDVTVDDVINLGLLNMKKKSIKTDFRDVPFFDVITTKEMVCGAVSVICLRDELKQNHPNGYWVIPSSVHEVLVLSDAFEMDEERINEMIGLVNTTEVSEEDFLSDHAYFIKS